MFYDCKELCCSTESCAEATTALWNFYKALSKAVEQSLSERTQRLAKQRSLKQPRRSSQKSELLRLNGGM